LLGPSPRSPETSLYDVFGATRIDGDLELRGYKGRALGSLACLESVGGHALIGVGPVCPSGMSGCITTTFDFGLETFERLQAVGGELSITTATRLRSLEALRSLRSVGSLHVSFNPVLESLAGLEQITEAESVSIDNNPALVSLAGLSGLKRIRGDLGIYRNAALPSFQGLTIRDIEGGLVLGEQPLPRDLRGFEELQGIQRTLDLRALAITSLEALRNVTPGSGTLTDDIVLEDLPLLENLDGFPYVTTLHGGLRITRTGLRDLRALSPLTILNGSLEIADNAGLGSLVGLDHVGDIGGDLAIRRNATLASLDLDGVSEVRGSLHLHDNAALPACVAEAFARRVGETCLGEAPCTGVCGCNNGGPDACETAADAGAAPP
jgi:hypothetical protein